MTIRQTEIAGVLAYLLAAQAITATDGQAVVWHDYLTCAIPDLTAAELRPACRDAIRVWATEGRAWRIDVEHYAAAIRRLRADRVRAEEAARGTLRPDGLGDDPSAETAWRRAAVAAIGRGAPRAEAEADAWRAAGRRSAPPAVGAGRREDGPVGAERGREALRRLGITPREATRATLTARNRPGASGYRDAPERPTDRLPRPLAAASS